jgi:hypothetical protein
LRYCKIGTATIGKFGKQSRRLIARPTASFVSSWQSKIDGSIALGRCGGGGYVVGRSDVEVGDVVEVDDSQFGVASPYVISPSLLTSHTSTWHLIQRGARNITILVLAAIKFIAFFPYRSLF